jgi:hypothetical protein
MISNVPFRLMPELIVTCAFGDYLRSYIFQSDFSFYFNWPHHSLSSPHFLHSILPIHIFALVIKCYTLPVPTFYFNRPAGLKLWVFEVW